MSTWQEGEYPATTKAGTIYEKDNKLIFAASFDVGGNEMKAYFVLINADGSVNTKTIDKMKEWSGWDGTDPYWLLDAMPSGINVSVTIKNEPGYKDASKLFPKIQWVNAIREKAAMPETADKSKIMMKFGSKLRAAAGPVATAPVDKPAPTAPTSKPAPTAPKPPAPKPVPPKKGEHACLEECWKMCQDKFSTLDEGAIAEKWYSFIDATGMDQATMTPEGWDKVKLAIEAEKDDCPL
jgi:hypothetical protein